MQNPLDFVTQQDIEQMGLSEADILSVYQPSSGGVYHARGAEGKGKTLLLAHIYRQLIDSGLFLPSDAIGNLTFKGKYGNGFTTLKGQDLFDYLLWFSRTLPRHKIVIVTEIDREFPARFFAIREQTEIALAMWEIQKIGSYFLMDSHIGNSTDLIFHLGSHYLLYPDTPVFETQTLDFTVIDNLRQETSEYVATDIVKTMLIYNRCETTSVRRDTRKKNNPLDGSNHQGDYDLDLDAEVLFDNLL